MPTHLFEEILPNILLVECAMVSVVLVKGERTAIVDTGLAEFMPAAIMPALAALNRKLSDIELIVNTHGHFDHVQGNPAIRQAAGAPVWIPAAEIGSLTAPPERLLLDGDRVDLGGDLCFEVITVPGHAPGMSCLYAPRRRLLIAADAAQGYNEGFPLYLYSGRQYRAGLQRLLELDMETMVLGHRFLWSGSAQMIHFGAEVVRRFLQESLEAARQVERAVQRALDACSDRSLDCIWRTAARELADDPAYPFDPTTVESLGWFKGTVRSELADLGIRHTNP